MDLSFAQKLLRRCRYTARLIIASWKIRVDSLPYLIGVFSLCNGQFERECPICGYSGYFEAFGYPPRFDAKCKKCGSIDRHRLLYLYWKRTGALKRSDTVLHFAAEPAIREFLRNEITDYIAADLSGADMDRELDIESIEMESEQVDVVICNHVLEHVSDDKALLELYRVLKPGGVLYCMVPIVEGWDQTYENASVKDDQGRLLHFAQADHVRVYGRDLRDRITNAGFFLEEFTASGEEVVRYGLMRGERVFVGRKPAMSPNEPEAR